MGLRGPKKGSPAPASAWKKGQSGNPGGREKLTLTEREARAEAQSIIDMATPAAALTAVEMLNHPDFRARALAMNSILDRGGLKGVDRIELLSKTVINAEVTHTHEFDQGRAIKLLKFLNEVGAYELDAAQGTDDSQDNKVHDSTADIQTNGLSPHPKS